jgi:lysyl-tRNA synthetase class 2
MSWQPTASLMQLQARAKLYQKIREFFIERHVLEVETPILSQGSVPEPMIAPFLTHYHGVKKTTLFLQTSPELPMKRLLAAGSGAIYQITKVFRDGESGRWHNPEFSMLEWYRPDYSAQQLIQEVDALLQYVLQSPALEYLTYAQAFERYVGLHPLDININQLRIHAQKLGFVGVDSLDRDTCLQFIMSQEIEPQLGHLAPIAITDFPATQAALAVRRSDDPRWAERFEIYVRGMELANGFYELTDAREQRQRFICDLEKRQHLNLPQYPLDEKFLDALHAGMPACSGIALGLDRLLMLQTQATHIDEVLAFPINRA